MELTNSKRLVYTASHVTTMLTAEEQKKQENKPGRGILKANFLRSLSITKRELPVLKSLVKAKADSMQANELQSILEISDHLLSNEDGILNPSLAASLAKVSDESLYEFGKLAEKTMPDNKSLAFLVGLFNYRRRVHPVGRLHLERIEMYPAGIEKGELVFSVPMAPKETVTISHKEWSTSSHQFEDIVNDYFESYSERGVAEKTDASMASENENEHATSLNFGASASGGFAGVTLTTTLGISDTNKERESVKTSMQKSRDITEKASARSRKEHKVSVKLESSRGIEDSSFRTIANPESHAVRVDYYRMMRKWRTDLFRYGLRLTYDITIPTPGARVWGRWLRVRQLDAEINKPFVFNLKPWNIHDGNWTVLANDVGISISAPPPPRVKVSVPDSQTNYSPEDQAYVGRYGQLDFEVPANYELEWAKATADLAIWAGRVVEFRWFSGKSEPSSVPNHGSPTVAGDLSDLIGRTGKMSVSFFYANVSTAKIGLRLDYARTKTSFQAWQAAAWDAIHAAAAKKYQEDLAKLQAERNTLYRLLVGKDTLTLRRLEREELLRLIIQWLVGPDNPVLSTPVVEATIKRILVNESMAKPTFDGMAHNEWFQSLEFGQFVKFVHEAIEWENLLYFFYPYFWGSQEAASDKLLFEHPDPEHERFLRAGYARVVITVRPGFEKAFTNFVETGSLTPNFVSTYVPIAEEIANFAKTNYAGIPPANPELQARPLLYPEQRATWESMQVVMAALETFKAANKVFPPTLAGLPGPVHQDAWGNDFVYHQPGLGADYDLISLGANNTPGGTGLDADICSAAGASLVATWSDYTPTSALDIEVDTKPEDIA